MNQKQSDILNNSIKELMSDMLKEDIYNIALSHDLDVDKRTSKKVLVEKLNEILVEDFEKDCQYLLPRELFYFMSLYLQFEKDHPSSIKTVFQAILEKNNYEIDDIDGDYLVERGYFQIVREDDTHTMLYPYPPIIVSFLTNFMDLLTITEKNQKMLDYAIALTNIYGWVPYSQYVHIWNLYNENKITEKIAKDFFEVMGKKEPEIWVHDKTVINEILTLEDYKYLEPSSKQHPWYTPSEEMIEKSVNTLVDSQSKAYKALEEFFKKNKGSIQSAEELDDIIHEILLMLKVDNPPSTFFEMLEEFGYIFEDKQEVETFMKLFQEISSNSRKWTLRGFTPKEISQLFYN